MSKNMAHDDYYNDDELVEWHNCYKQRKAQRAQIKEELMAIAWHPISMQDQCMEEDVKKRIEEISTWGK